MTIPTPSAPPASIAGVTADPSPDVLASAPVHAAETGGEAYTDPATFSLDDFIGAVGRPHADVSIYNADPAWQARYDEAMETFTRADRRLAKARAEEENDVERSITDLGSAGFEAEVIAAGEAIEALRRERDSRRIVVTVEQRTPDEVAASHLAGRAAGLPPDLSVAQVVADAITAVRADDGRDLGKFTAGQLVALINRDVSGHAAFLDLRAKLEQLGKRPSVPSSPGSSTSRGTGESSAR